MHKKIDKKLLCHICCEDCCKVGCFVYLNGQNPHEVMAAVGKDRCKYFEIINAVYVMANALEIKKLCRLKCVNYVSKELEVCTCCNVSKKITRTDKLHQMGITGKDVTIAYIDTGISPHYDFVGINNRVVAFKDVIFERQDIYDDNGHGTAVAGAGSGSGALSGMKNSGFAPQSNIVSVKALGRNGEAEASKILEGMQWVLENKKTYNIKVVCMSFGSEPIFSYDPIARGAERLWNEGIVVVGAAGNSGPEFGTIKSPGSSRKIITVGGMNDGRGDNKPYEVANFSSRGPIFNVYKPDLIASAVDVESTTIEDGKLYAKMSGTSIAAPMVAGLCALYLQTHKNANPMQVKAKLLMSCNKINCGRNNEGFGYPDALKFLFA